VKPVLSAMEHSTDGAKHQVASLSNQ
jgi:hypothetical protein